MLHFGHVQLSLRLSGTSGSLSFPSFDIVVIFVFDDVLSIQHPIYRILARSWLKDPCRMAQSYAMKSGSKFVSEIHHSRSSFDDAGTPGIKSINRDDEEMAKLGKRQELRVSNCETLQSDTLC